MTVLVAPNLDALFLKLQPFIGLIVPAGTPIMRAPLNRVAQPAVDHVMMTHLFFKRLRTNVTTYDDPAPESMPGTALAEKGTEVHVQVDFYGSLAADWSEAFETLFRSEFATEALAPVCAPLYADEARMIPLVTGEQQYLERYAVTAVLQYNPVAFTPQQFADSASVVLVEVDTRYPPV
jgi:hypothetical protein